MNETATFASGCFWCTEAIFLRLNGVSSVISGYTGGKTVDPTYEQVSTGMTGHAEAIQISFNPSIISYQKLLEIFFETHDPTSKDRQGADHGTQYRSVIFYHSEEQKHQAEDMISTLTKTKRYQEPIVTEVLPALPFYQAEEYHQDFYAKNREYPYCTVVINPKLTKLLSTFTKEVKEEYRS